MTTLRTHISKLIKQSQALSGLSFQSAGLPAMFMALGFCLWLISGLFSVSYGSLSLPVKQANASVSMEDGAAINYSNGQRRHIRRAVLAEPDNLKKLHGLSILAALDKPEIIRTDLPAVVWQYRHGGCVLDIYFKSKDGKAENAPVVHYEMRSRSAQASDADLDEKTCLRGMMDAGAGTQMVGVSAFYKSYIQ